MIDKSNEEKPGTPDAEQTGPQITGKRQADKTEKDPAYGFWLATIALVLVSLVAFFAMLIFKGVFENATDVTTVLGALFTVVGTVVGTYFGIKTSGDTRDKLQGSIDKANETANRALAELPPDKARDVVGGG
ncbi:MAG: hypothetical protein M3392_01510 [Actinomycetota bacterium]|nr:hypothetical protein [Actinomycetota bacterium]